MTGRQLEAEQRTAIRAFCFGVMAIGIAVIAGITTVAR